MCCYLESLELARGNLTRAMQEDSIYFKNFDVVLSARILAPVWQVGQ
jgi:hypothetical protein